MKPLQVHKPFQDRPAAPDAASEVVRLQRSGCPPPGTVGNKGFRRGPCHSGLPRRQCAGESIEERSSPTRRFHVSDSGGAHSVDQRKAVRHPGRRHGRQCNRSQQVGRFDGRRNRSVEELDIESINVESHGGVNFEHLQVGSPRRGTS